METEIGKRYLHVKTGKVYWVSSIAPDASDGADGDIVTYHRRAQTVTFTYHRKRSEFEDGRFMEMKELNPLDDFQITWNIEDVIGHSNMSVDDARHVLRYLEHHHDANLGVNWDVIECAKEAALGKDK